MYLRPLTRTMALMLVAVATLTFGTASAQGPDYKIAVLDLDQVLAESSAGVQLKARLDQFLQTAQSEIASKAERVQGLQKKITDGTATLPAEEIAGLEKEFQTAAVEFRNFQDDKQRAGQQMQADGLRAIEEKLQPIFQKIRDAEGYDLIINNAPGIVMIASSRVDITRKVIDQLNASTATP